ncbi:acyloxyacyl hydrolase isoform X3 [Delphinapterus leucas]|uniref:Acyloxyacyl hydrolase isoform X3 n=1 Tax=Delphinapterus leucas TaxID=9749 RepID=A0A2Y9P123_DELLE|nr:acyloxyacyl hydrolase isoform X3 [Delphinapterus leucas]
MKPPWKILMATPLFFLLTLHTLASPAYDHQPGTRRSKGQVCIALQHSFPCDVADFCSLAGCVLVVSVIEQLAQVHNSTVQTSMERLCSYLPEKLFLKTTCYLVVSIFGPDIIKLLKADVNADVVCHTLEFCKQDPGQPLCHLYPLPKTYSRSGSDICSLPFLAKICQRIKLAIQNSLPFKDVDSDKYSVFPTLRGSHWRGRDCNDSNKMAYPGRRPDNWDTHQDSNCNGIWGVDPKDGIPYEKKFCEGSQPRGIILLGDSAGAHFHIPPDWITASQMSLKSFFNLPTALTNELDWPQLSGTTGFLDSTSRVKENSIYLRLRKRNHCNHRDYQNISRNGASSQSLERFIESLSRNQLLDQPAIVIYAMIGNDVCNGKIDPVPGMTTPEKLYSKVMETLQYLDSHLPNGSHVILYGLPDGTFLWDNLHSRYHPLGQLNKDVTYAHLYSFLSCLQVSPCHGWMSSNKTLRTLTSERAEQLSITLKKIATSQKFTNFNLFYMDFDFQESVCVCVHAPQSRRSGRRAEGSSASSLNPWMDSTLVRWLYSCWQIASGRRCSSSGPRSWERRIHSTSRLSRCLETKGGTKSSGTPAPGELRKAETWVNSFKKWLWERLCHKLTGPSSAASLQSAFLPFKSLVSLSSLPLCHFWGWLPK